MGFQVPELLAPAGDLEILRTAAFYGADAVYFGGRIGSLRADASGFSLEDISFGVRFLHEHGRKAYLTLNIFPHAEDMAELETFIAAISDFGLDAFIVSDPAVIALLQKHVDSPELHLSTQANVTNATAARFWHKAGVSRLVLARELSLSEIRTIREETPDTLELEAFVHGAMCISYSGRCLLSSVMTGRDGNRGECAQPCRWEYSIGDIRGATLTEQLRPGEKFGIEEDERGTYIMNSKDLCLVRHLGELHEAGVTSFKIEGRMKSLYYVATVVNTYRYMMDRLSGISNTNLSFGETSEKAEEDLAKVSHREYTTGFLFGKAGPDSQKYDTSSYIRGWSFIGTVIAFDDEEMIATIEQRGKFSVGETLEIFGPGLVGFLQQVKWIKDEEGNEMSSAPHPMQHVKIPIEQKVEAGYMLRRKA
ncbi:MAG: U32 family peptidase [Clostridiales Family XIII bacterium]|jgi:putative protease|nr:U32 family peptidase [Clostridiales Family XIII bacterium]